LEVVGELLRLGQLVQAVAQHVVEVADGELAEQGTGIILLGRGTSGRGPRRGAADAEEVGLDRPPDVLQVVLVAAAAAYLGEAGAWRAVLLHLRGQPATGGGSLHGSGAILRRTQANRLLLRCRLRRSGLVAHLGGVNGSAVGLSVNNGGVLDW